MNKSKPPFQKGDIVTRKGGLTDGKWVFWCLDRDPSRERNMRGDEFAIAGLGTSGFTLASESILDEALLQTMKEIASLETRCEYLEGLRSAIQEQRQKHD